MKTLLPNVERRIIVRPNPVWGIINYDIDNAYPQRVLELVRQSPTAKKCWRKREKHLGGNGFAEAAIGEVVVNIKKQITLAKLLKAITKDKALFPGFGIHVNYNANYKIVSVKHVKYEDIRQGDTDTEKYAGKYVIYRDWGRKTWRSIYLSKFDVIDAFNPDPAVIKAQVIAAGGWDQYKGQMFYLTPVVDDYDLCEFDAALEDIETEAGIKTFNNRQVKTGFMPSAVIFTKARKEGADIDGPEDEEINDGMAGQTRLNRASTIEEDLADFQSVEKAQKIIVFEYEDDAFKPELAQYNIQNNDKLFDSTSAKVEGNIIKAFDVPKELVSEESANGLSNGGEKAVAIREFNDDTRPERKEISDVFKLIFDNFYTNVNPSGNWDISEVTTEGSSPDVIKEGPEIRELCESKVLKAKRKIAILNKLYGFSIDEAKSMVPTDAEMQAIQEAQVANDNLKFKDTNELPTPPADAAAAGNDNQEGNAE